MQILWSSAFLLLPYEYDIVRLWMQFSLFEWIGNCNRKYFSHSINFLATDSSCQLGVERLASGFLVFQRKLEINATMDWSLRRLPGSLIPDAFRLFLSLVLLRLREFTFSHSSSQVSTTFNKRWLNRDMKILFPMKLHLTRKGNRVLDTIQVNFYLSRILLEILCHRAK